MKRDDIMNVDGAVEALDTVLQSAENAKDFGPVAVLSVNGALAMVQMALLAEISDKLTALSVQLGRK